MSLLDQTIILHVRGVKTGEDELGEPIYGPPGEVPIEGWFEMAGSTEDTAAAQQTVNNYWVFTEDTRIKAVDQVTLMTFDGPMLCDVGTPQSQPDGFDLPGYIRVLATRASG